MSKCPENVVFAVVTFASCDHIISVSEQNGFTKTFFFLIKGLKTR